MSDLSDLFGNVVFSYGDQQAIDDGMIVDITAYRVIVNDKPLNRASASVWAKFGDADPDATEEQHAVCRKAMFDFMASVARLTPTMMMKKAWATKTPNTKQIRPIRVMSLPKNTANKKKSPSPSAVAR